MNLAPPPSPSIHLRPCADNDRGARLGPAEEGDGFVDRFGGRFYRITDVDRMPAFFMSVVSASDVWLFLSSNGALTAGRGNADHALFPYQTVDRIHDSAGHTGGCTVLRVETSAGVVPWEPFAPHGTRSAVVRRHLYKAVEGDRVWFEEIHPELGLVFRQGWTATAEHGVVRSAEVENLRPSETLVSVLDGVRNLMVPGVSRRLQNEFSCLTDAYKSAERAPGAPLAIFALAAAIVDRPIPMESLLATTAWADGWPEAELVLAADAADCFAHGEEPRRGDHARGVRAACALRGDLVLRPGEIRRWRLVLDTDRTQVQVAALAARLRTDAGRRDARDELDGALLASAAALRALVASADGVQRGGDETATAHHFANTLFNVMRGGVFAFGAQIDAADFGDFVRTRNRAVAALHASLLAGLPARLAHADFIARIVATGDPHLERLAREHLPLTFSRRHGDPSRPWNRFNIRVRDAAGARILDHEGNWRDIFQNWEALCVAFPDFCESAIARFLNASTADGHNPYRIARSGVDWEVPEPEDPWASIGYWGDHQTIYLLRLLEWSARFHPGRLTALARRELFVFADVPYRIADYDAVRRNPRATITFDTVAHERALARERELGGDGRLVTGSDGLPLRVNLVEKLLLVALVRVYNLVPDGGIWMNTQRPEWNDANNALAGYGLSVVTLAHLHRYLAHLENELVPELGEADVGLSAPTAALLRELHAVLVCHAGEAAAVPESPRLRRAFVDAAGAAGERHRARVYAGDFAAAEKVGPAEIAGFIIRARELAARSLQANRRPDGLWHSYNLVRFIEQPPAIEVGHLAPMLEGQVAVLGAGLLAPAGAAELLRSLRASPLYRPDQHSYLLYPDRSVAGFLERNKIPEGAVADAPLLAEAIRRGETRLAARDAEGRVRFHPDLVNADALAARLDELARDPSWREAVKTGRAAVAAAYETVFHHHAFTGRSSSMFGYEGLGCIYWHMVAKLLLAAQENLIAAERAGDPAAGELAARYRDIRDGLGYRKSARLYGAFPTDPYSHTPGHAGAQQPGMTGQVKEELLTRLAELGVLHETGTVVFKPERIEAGEFATKSFLFENPGAGARTGSIAVPAGGLAFTLCGTPVVCVRSGDGGPRRLRVHRADHTSLEISGDRLALPPFEAAALFGRDGSLTLIEIHFPAE